MFPDDYRKQQPHLEKLGPYLEVLNAESARGKVLVSTGFLEEQLKEILVAHFLECPEAGELVEGGSAPLATLSARISACYVLGLITKNEHDDLQIIRKIRNDFAHDLHTTFDTERVVNRCRELRHAAKHDPKAVAKHGPIPAAGSLIPRQSVSS